MGKVKLNIFRIIASGIVIVITLSGCAKANMPSQAEATLEQILTPQQTQQVVPTSEETQSSDLKTFAYKRTIWIKGSPFNDIGYFRFAFLGPFGVAWSNDGADPPEINIPQLISNGMLEINLGDTSLEGMTQPITSDAFPYRKMVIQTWFSPDGISWDRLLDQEINSPYPPEVNGSYATNSEFPTGLFIPPSLPDRSMEFNNEDTYILTGWQSGVDLINYVKYTIDGDQLTDFFDLSSCRSAAPATYKWTHIGNWLIFELIGEDECAQREDDYNKIWVKVDQE
ncbi:MAG: hypothetical protein MUO40_12880 [Anaerolineaceae bacterium]|nr:hypothetical protein [Anaerolineaceae bacterium]